MDRIKWMLCLSLICLFSSFCFLQEKAYQIEEDRLLSHIVDPQKGELHFFWKDDAGENFKNFAQLKAHLNEENKTLLFAMNGGMYQKDLSPQGLYVEKGMILSPTNRVQDAYGNFYLQPNGIFYLTKDQQAVVCPTKDFIPNDHIQYATQSGPLLLIDGQMHPKLKKGSNNLHIRNGVGVLPNGHLLFAMSKEKINFYDFATFFKQNGCRDALYLDGFVSRAYLPTKDWIQETGNFGVIIAEVELE